MRWARFLCFALLMTSAAVMAEEPETEVDDVDRTDFSEAHLQDAALKVENPPHSDVTTTALLPDGTELALGKPSVLLVALANAGSKMFNVSTIDGYAEDAAGTRLQNFTVRHYGDPLGPREQRSVRYVFTPKKELGLGAFKLTFAIHYNDKAKDRFGGPVLTSSVTLVAAPVNPMDSDLVKYGAPAGGGLVVLLLLYSLVGGGKKGGAKKGEAKAAAAAEGGNEWLKDTLAGTEGRKQKGSKKKA